ncbi:GNAT family N-acetyltransferase [Halovenus salina]|uniref:GNAT family N-acetyltransferase n=1 Tax=Halovenus salina TaxID=1510225 RepID=A0ABD5W070_9EURY|nr:GNAT family N-acetyltransferase [Halovenus salina]
MTLSIREAVTADGSAIRDLHLASIEGLAGSAYTDAQVDAWAHERDPDGYPIDSPQTYFVVAERGDSLVGFGWTKPDADDYFECDVDGEITAVYVSPDATREGVGSRIYAELERYAREAGVNSLGLWASLNAVTFYEAQDYNRVTRHTLEFSDGVEGDVVEMRKSLS